jgi:anti-sigma regulatory factor (Ser/Thr protein kinase)
MSSTRTFPPDPLAVRQARRFAADQLRGIDPAIQEVVELMVSELATNCVRHAHSDFTISVRYDRDHVRVEVVDAGEGAPVPRSPRNHEPTGRGLRIIEQLAGAWGIERRPHGGNLVWFETDVPGVAPA